MLNIKPAGNRIVVQRLESSDKQGMIYIPDAAREKPSQGIVVAVGPGRRGESGRRLPVDVFPGDRIIFSKYAGNEVRVLGDDLLIVRDDEILGVVEEPLDK